MESVRCSLLESETPPFQITETASPNLSALAKHTSNEKEQSDRQFSAEATYAAFVWLFGSGCY